MQMLCPIKYEIQGTTGTNRRIKKYSYEEVVTVDIPEIDSRDAPVAVEWVPETNSGFKHGPLLDRRISGPDGKQLTRWYENAHWQRMCDGHLYGERERGQAVTVEHLQAMLMSPQNYSSARAAIELSLPNGGQSTSKTAHVSVDPRERFTSIRADGRELAMKYLNTAIDGLISVEGIVHRKCIEPFISVALHFPENEENLRVRELGIETTANALWGGKTTIFAEFGLNSWGSALDFIKQTMGSNFDKTTIPSEPRIFIGESLTYDWDVTFKVAKEAEVLRRSLSFFSRLNEPKLEKVIRSQDSEEQYEIMLSLDPNNPQWVGNASARQSYEKIFDILENREIVISLANSAPVRP